MFMHWLKKLSIVSAAVFVFAGHASATNLTLSYGTTNHLAIVNRDAGVLDEFTFNDVYDLDMQVAGVFSLLTTEIEDASYNIVDSSFSYGLYDIDNNLLTTPSILTPGAYQLRVTGKADGFSGGQYFLSFNVTTPVPEPDLGLMMLFGLTMMGLVSLRKSHSA
jgi:hypothetical protein